MTLDVDRELTALAAAAADYDARHHIITECGWPDGTRIAVNFTVDFDAMLLRRLLNGASRAAGEKRVPGGRVGIWRLIELFDSHAIKATIFTPGRICELYPEAVKAAARDGHEIADHMWEHRVPKDPALELDHLRKAKAAIERLAGRRPVGTRSWHTQRPCGTRDTSTIRTMLRTTDRTIWAIRMGRGSCSICRSILPSMTPCTSASPGSIRKIPRSA